jgi:hypothetical protein
VANKFFCRINAKILLAAGSSRDCCSNGNQFRDDAEIPPGTFKRIRLPHRFVGTNFVDVVEGTRRHLRHTGWSTLALEGRRDNGRLAMRTYNLFRRADRDELICAVPEDRPVPSFITGPPWEFVGRVNESVIGPLSFNHEAAEASVQWNGFYLFQLINVADLHLKARRGSATASAEGAPASGKDPRQTAPTPSPEIRLTAVQVRLEVEVGAPPDNRASPLSVLLNDTDLGFVRK